MKTRTYLLLFIAASLLVIVGVLFKIEKIDGGDAIPGISVFCQGALIVGYLIQNSLADRKK